MATSKVMLSRLSCRLKLLSHTKLPKQPSSSSSSLSPPSAPRITISRTSRLPVELGGVGSMMPFHSAVASARLVSSLCVVSQGWCLVPQGSLSWEFTRRAPKTASKKEVQHVDLGNHEGIRETPQEC